MINISPLILGYQGKEVLRFAGLELPRGGQCLIAGASGSGKTTLLYALAGLITPLSGRITIKNTEISALKEAGRDRFRAQHIGIVFQTLHLVKSLTVLDNLLLASYMAGLPQQAARACALLDRLGVLHKKGELPERLSQGQAQRVAIARAMLHSPAVLLADEPTSSLDDGACAQVIGLLREAAQETNAALIISTHDSRVKAHFSQVVTLGDAA